MSLFCKGTYLDGTVIRYNMGTMVLLLWYSCYGSNLKYANVVLRVTITVVTLVTQTATKIENLCNVEIKTYISPPSIVLPIQQVGIYFDNFPP